jgi:hypothetical protein
MIIHKEPPDSPGRHWIKGMLDRFEDPNIPEGDRRFLIVTLQSISDPEAIARLESIIVDVAKPRIVRQAAGVVLRDEISYADKPAELLRRWWEEGDDILRQHAFAHMNSRSCPEIVREVAHIPSYPFLTAALRAMKYGFDSPEDVALRINYLTHPHVGVRAAAADSLEFDAPVAAQEPLHLASCDDEPDVTVAAAKALEAYPSLASIHRLDKLGFHSDSQVREAVDTGLSKMKFLILTRLRDPDQRVVKRLRDWLQPVWDFLAFSECDLTARPGATVQKRPERHRTIPPSELLDLLSRDDIRSPADLVRMYSLDWSGYTAAEREQLRPHVLAGRFGEDEGCRALASWHDAAGILEIARGAGFWGRKSALECLSKFPPGPETSPLILDYLHKNYLGPSLECETTEVYARHADRGWTVQWLHDTAGDADLRQALRLTALKCLVKMGAAAEVSQLAWILREPPLVSWDLHVALLNAMPEMSLPVPDLGHLQSVDHLFMQAALARACA